MSDDDQTYVITRLGNREPLEPGKIQHRLNLLANKAPAIKHVDTGRLTIEVCRRLVSGITTYEIDEYAADAATSMSLEKPYYLKLAARIAVDNHQRNTARSFLDKMRTAYMAKDTNGKHCARVNAKFFKYVEEHQDVLERMIDYSRDFELDYFGIRTFQKSYGMRIDGKCIERPQDLFARTVIAVHMNTVTSIDEELQMIKKAYDMLSKKKYTFASPCYYNAGGPTEQMASCFLLDVDDSLEGIMDATQNMAKTSKRAGGCGTTVDRLRAKGSFIRGTNGPSSGIIPMLKIFQATMGAFNQGGNRAGVNAIYSSMHNPEIMSIIKAARTSGTEEERVNDLFYGLWINDLFMERVNADEMWSMFDPNTVGVDLTGLHGAAYETKYKELEAKGLWHSQIPAREIWRAAFVTKVQTGLPYYCYADNVNKCNNHENLGTVRSSNLCTEIMLHTTPEEYATCILSSICLSRFVYDSHTPEELAQPEESRRALDHEFPKNPQFDFRDLIEVTKMCVLNLNAVVDKTVLPTEEARRGNDRNRPIGIGVQGLADTYAAFRYPFASEEAAKLNKQIFETIYYAAMSQSAKMARARYMELKREIVLNGSVTVDHYTSDSYDVTRKTYTRIHSASKTDLDKSDVDGKSAEDEAGTMSVGPSTVPVGPSAGPYRSVSQSLAQSQTPLGAMQPESDVLPKTAGSYPSMTFNGGAPISRGVFHWEMFGLTEKDLTCDYDWESLREMIKIYGVRNSHLIALMPTATTSQFMANNEAFEPWTANVYKRTTSSGEFIVMNKFLIRDLYNLGLWNTAFKEYMLLCGGSVQYIEGLPQELKDLYPTAREIDQRVLIDQAIARQPFVDQAQSLNLYTEQMSEDEWTQLQFYAWSNGLKTGCYYLHSKAATNPIPFTIDPAKQAHARELMSKRPAAVYEKPAAYCDSCSA